ERKLMHLVPTFVASDLLKIPIVSDTELDSFVLANKISTVETRFMALEEHLEKKFDDLLSTIHRISKLSVNLNSFVDGSAVSVVRSDADCAWASVADLPFSSTHIPAPKDTVKQAADVGLISDSAGRPVACRSEV